MRMLADGQRYAVGPSVGKSRGTFGIHLSPQLNMYTLVADLAVQCRSLIHECCLTDITLQQPALCLFPYCVCVCVCV